MQMAREEMIMSTYQTTKADWKLFQELLPRWQERYMARLCDEYAAILTGPKRGPKAFWEIEKRIKSDRKRPGVLVHMEKKEVPYIILGLIRDKVITLDNLEGFSDGLKERLDDLMEFWSR